MKFVEQLKSLGFWRHPEHKTSNYYVGFLWIKELNKIHRVYYYYYLILIIYKLSYNKCFKQSFKKNQFYEKYAFPLRKIVLSLNMKSVLVSLIIPQKKVITYEFARPESHVSP